MPRPVLAHLAWAQLEAPGHAWNLADSAIATPDLEALGLPSRAGLPASGHDPLPELERALGARIGAPDGRVMVAAGASEANAAAFAALLEPGEEALVEAPGYEPHRAVPAFFGAPVRTFRRGRDLPVTPAVEAALGPGTRLVVLTHLHNPGGGALAADDALALDALAARRGFRVLCDETFREAAAGPPGSWSALGGRWVCTGTLTKVFGLGALRIGWVAAHAEALAACRNAHRALSAVPSQPAVALALALVPHLDALRARAHAILAANHAAWERVAARAPGFEAEGAPRGITTWCVFPGERGGDAFAAFAGARFDLALAPGRFFGDTRGVRVALGGEPGRCAAALDRFEQAAAAFTGTREAAREPA